MTHQGTWKRVNLPDAYWFQEGPGVRKWQFKHFGIKLLNVSNITKDGILDLDKTDRYLDQDEVEQKYSHFLVDAGDLVIASSGITFDEDELLRTRGVFVNESHLPLCMNTSTIRFKAQEGISDLRYLRHWLDSFEFRSQITHLVTGIAQQNFGPSHLKQIHITLPPLAEQKRIAAILDQADALRVKRRAALARLDRLVQSVFLEMFGDPVTNPMGWEVRPLEDLADIVSGVTKGRKFGNQETVIVPYMRVANVQDGVIDTSDIKTIEVLPSDVEKYQLQAGDLLLTEGGDPDKLGRGAVWKGEIFPCIHQNHIFRVRLTSNTILPGYLSALIGSKRGKLYFLRAAKQTTGIATINKTQLASFPTLLPNYDIQKKYLQAMENIGMLRKRALSHFAHTDNLFHALQQRAFRGDL